VVDFELHASPESTVVRHPSTKTRARREFSEV
jgi:hypothetical protein